MTTNNSLEIISYDKLIEAIENDLTSNNFKTAAEFLNAALNDWPTINLHEPSDLLLQVRREINGKLTYANLEIFSKQQDLGLGA